MKWPYSWMLPLETMGKSARSEGHAKAFTNHRSILAENRPLPPAPTARRQFCGCSGSQDVRLSEEAGGPVEACEGAWAFGSLGKAQQADERPSQAPEVWNHVQLDVYLRLAKQLRVEIAQVMLGRGYSHTASADDGPFATSAMQMKTSTGRISLASASACWLWLAFQSIEVRFPLSAYKWLLAGA
eukprot:scaffold2429_cov263-Pinguiococcus_pyrenoidosus.AAC.6